VGELFAVKISLGSLLLPGLLFGVKQLLADFVLQTGWMACGKGRAEGWVAPLLVHSGIHGVGTTLVALIAAPSLWWLGLADFVIHAIIDRTKAAWCQGRFRTDQPGFWWAFGVDQEAHALTHLVLAVIMALTVS
jgi:hypothetical protein